VLRVDLQQALKERGDPQAAELDLSELATRFYLHSGRAKLQRLFQKDIGAAIETAVPRFLRALVTHLRPGAHTTLLWLPLLEWALAEQNPGRNIYAVMPAAPDALERRLVMVRPAGEKEWREEELPPETLDLQRDFLILRMYGGYSPEAQPILTTPQLTEDDHIRGLVGLRDLFPLTWEACFMGCLRMFPFLGVGLSVFEWRHRMLLTWLLDQRPPSKISVVVTKPGASEAAIWDQGAGGLFGRGALRAFDLELDALGDICEGAADEPVAPPTPTCPACAGRSATTTRRASGPSSPASWSPTAARRSTARRRRSCARSSSRTRCPASSSCTTSAASSSDEWPDNSPTLAGLVAELLRQLDLVPAMDAGQADLAAVRQVIDRAYRVSDRPLVIVLYGLERLLDDGRDRAADRKFVDALAVLVDLPIRGLQLVMAVPEVDLGAFRHLLRGHYRLLANDLRLHGDDRRLIIPIGFVGAGGTTVVAGAAAAGAAATTGIGALIAGGVLGVAGIVLAAVGLSSLRGGAQRPRQRRRRPPCAPRAPSARRARRSCRRREVTPEIPRRIRRPSRRTRGPAYRTSIRPGCPTGSIPIVDPKTLMCVAKKGDGECAKCTRASCCKDLQACRSAKWRNCVLGGKVPSGDCSPEAIEKNCRPLALCALEYKCNAVCFK
jgi:hypothetical protein